MHKCVVIHFFTQIQVTGFRIKLHWSTEVQMYNKVIPMGMLHVKSTGLTVLLLLHHKQNAFIILNYRHLTGQPLQEQKSVQV